MTDIRKAAEERYPHLAVGNMTARADFIAGAEWMREQAAQVAEALALTFRNGSEDGEYEEYPEEWSTREVRDATNVVAAAIRKIGENDD